MKFFRGELDFYSIVAEMNPLFPIKEEFTGSSSSDVDGKRSAVLTPPVPMEGLHDAGPPPFLTKTFEIVDDFNTDHGFRKIDPDRWEFANEGFIRGQKHLLKNIKRRRTTSYHHHQTLQSQGASGACVEVGQFGVDAEMDRLKRDKQVLMMELVKLRQEQQNTRAYLQAMEQRLRGTEIKQKQMMNFLARAMKNPSFIQQLVQQKEKRKELEEAITKKRRRPIEQAGQRNCGGGSGRFLGEGSNTIKIEPLESDEYGFGITELEALALEMQGLGKTRYEDGEEEEDKEDDDDLLPPEDEDKVLDEGFWEELFSERLEEARNEDENVNVLADRFAGVSNLVGTRFCVNPVSEGLKITHSKALNQIGKDLLPNRLKNRITSCVSCIWFIMISYKLIPTNKGIHQDKCFDLVASVL
ncbi:heat stress transcription factor A-6b-like isoform X1 [Cucumis melo var. makuwa]|uniref:Heat stress transcription factor A-6b-like isoform X1 n=1 Tax=Cucumis melo var. makuwa TaxID=1194695 RepID=A0A5A7VE84_CUCMM|nr:heat stress transcription factor A-6b-like isoform X1 [Cucumis melo var. makuwa]TYK26192.1 heat stress transcription factor A-6b-like isoform X1 [Cucumis melo var. makuwa]